MPKIFVASFNRASDGALSLLISKLKKEGMYTDDYKDADYILACGDRKETFDFVLERFRENKRIIHLWAGEISQGTHDEVYRHAMTLMSCIQLCTNNEAKEVVKNLCKSVDKVFLVSTVGNLMLDNLEVDESCVPEDRPFDVVLYNPPTLHTRDKIKSELEYINEIKKINTIWLSPNGDLNSDLIQEYVNMPNLSRPSFLGLLKNCDKFITNSSCQYYEAPFLMSKDNIVSIGIRNEERSSKYSDMTISGASDNIIKLLKELDHERQI
jgi:GDP/UDP-N,N'-diacetylbacillosamine 2-epimerase (hydrolysing)